MRYRLAVLTVFAVLPLMNALAAPAPEPYAILDIGPPPKGMTTEAYSQSVSKALSDPDGVPRDLRAVAEVRKLPAVAALKDARPWLAKNIHITTEAGGRLLRVTFRAGSHAAQVTIVNAMLRLYVRHKKEALQRQERILRKKEALLLDLKKRLSAEKNPNMISSYKKAISEMRSIQIPARRAEIARLKQIAVTKEAK
ncbi:MAG: hypothetical protein ACRELG_25800 [Gemmataceae bacterium]